MAGWLCVCVCVCVYMTRPSHLPSPHTPDDGGHGNRALNSSTNPAIRAKLQRLVQVGFLQMQ